MSEPKAKRMAKALAGEKWPEKPHNRKPQYAARVAANAKEF